MKSASFDFITSVKLSEFFSARYKHRLGLKEEPHPIILPHQALLQVQHEKIEALFKREEPIFRISKDEAVSYDDIAIALSELSKNLLKAQIELIHSAGKPFGGGSK